MKKLLFLSIVASCILAGCKSSDSGTKTLSDGIHPMSIGFQLLYHNHDFEFAKLPDGTVGHDYIFSSTTPGDVMVELDACWADYAGGKFEFRPLGKGIMDLHTLIECSFASGVRWLHENGLL